MDKQQAVESFRRLIVRYGLRWDAKVPRIAYDQLNEISAILTPDEKRDIARHLGVRTGETLDYGLITYRLD